MTPDKIRFKAFAVVRRKGSTGDQMLVSLGEDTQKNERFARIVGGSVEFGETSRATIIREMKEEFAVDVTVGAQLGWIENIFTYNGEAGHQITVIYDVTVNDPAFYQQEKLTIIDAPQYCAVWLSPAEMDAQGLKLYPADLRGML